MNFKEKTENESCCEEVKTSDCCSSNENSCGCGETNNSESSCSVCSHKSIKVSAVTLKAQLKKEFFENLKYDADDFHFCDNPACDTVYFSSDGKEKYYQDDIKSKVTTKNSDPKTPLCYCKKLLKRDVLKMIENGEENIPVKIKEHISKGKTFCEKSNPRGTCCTEAIALFLKEHDLDWNEASKIKSESCAC